MISTKEIAQLLKETAALLELKGEKAFRVKAYTNAARSVDRSGVQALELLELAGKGKIPGVGKGIAGDLKSIVESGSLPLRDELIQHFPDGLLELLKISGLGAKKLKTLYDELSIQNLDTLEAACNNQQLRGLKGFGKKTEENILAGVIALRSYSGKARRDSALKDFNLCKELITSSNSDAELFQSGELRRGNEIVIDLSIVCTGIEVSSLEKIFNLAPEASEIAVGDGILKCKLNSGAQISIHCCSQEDLALTLFKTTGSLEHVNSLKVKKSSYQSEDEIYQENRLPLIAPELREGKGEISICAKNPEAVLNLLSGEDIKGVLHSHSTYSDGKHTLKELACAVRDMGYEYLGISDHSQAAFYANGLKPGAIKKQHAEIDKLNQELAPFKIFKGIESDILKDGSLDYEESVLESFDFVIASIHARFGMNGEQMTERLIRAIENPYTTWVGHLSGRLLLKREPFDFDVEAVFQACEENKVALEINANPRRLDVDWRHLPELIKREIPLLICPDAHSIEGVDDISYGVSVARKGGVNASHVLNTMGLDQFEEFLQSRKP